MTFRKSINCRGKLLDLSKPRIMGILNVTPDSFSDGGLFLKPEDALAQAEKLLTEGADILDIGGASSRPGAHKISPSEELQRVLPVIKLVLENFPETIISIDSCSPIVVQAALEEGVSIINDISAGAENKHLFHLAAQYNAPYVLMHMQGIPETMQVNPKYDIVETEVRTFFVTKIEEAKKCGVMDIILDPGFGFGKTTAHNFALYTHLKGFSMMGYPLLVGFSRKRMLSETTGLVKSETDGIVSILHYNALQSGANILRVHNVKESVAVLKLYQYQNGTH
jgi:dihydropteroate synthase